MKRSTNRIARSPAAALLVLMAFASSLSAQAAPHPDELKLRPDIDTAIDRGVEYLIEQQLRDGSWGLHGNFLGGRAGLCLYTLLQSGVSRDHPAVRRAVRYLDSVEPETTYATTCMMLAYDALRMGREDRIASFCDKLISWQKPEGDWGYPHSHADLSNTQYAALGLWVAVKRGLDVDVGVFQRLVTRMEGYRAKVQQIDNPEVVDGRTGVAKVDVAGFQYRVGGKQKTTGSMTGAGIAVLSICKAGLGKKLRRPMRRKADEHIEAAMRWFARNFQPDRNPNGRHKFYYLYGVERVGALMQVEQLGTHWWYLGGARHLLKTQGKDDGGWKGVNETCFSLLFLRRATGAGRPVTGSKDIATHVFEAGGQNASIRLRGAGQRPVSLYIEGFGGRLVADHQKYGMRVVSVAYIDEEDRVLGRIAGDPTKAWQDEVFLYREKALARGDHRVRARVTLLAADSAPRAAAPGAYVAAPEAETVVVDSGWMDVRIRDVEAAWMVDSADAYGKNLLRTAAPKIVASSELDKNSLASNLFDGKDSSRWLAAEEDQAPSVLLSWKKSVRVGSVTIMLPAAHDQQRGDFDEVDGVELRFGNDRDEWHKVSIGRDPIAPLVYELKRSRRLRAIEVRFSGRVDRVEAHTGLAELILLPPKKRRRR
ncbi:MAG: hypothetical protein AB8H80_19390 [Planctomycetota bacterium]